MPYYSAPSFSMKRFASLLISLALLMTGLTVPGVLNFRPARAVTCSTAPTLSVNNIADLRTAVADAVVAANYGFPQGTTIMVGSGTYSLGGSQIEIGNALCPITIDGGANNAANVILDGGNASRVFLNHTGALITLNNLTIQHGSVTSDYGAGVENYGVLTINNSILSSNSAGDGFGGAVENAGGILTINNSTLSGNFAGAGNTAGSGSGGALNNNLGTVTISNSTLSGNQALNGGGVTNNTGTLLISNSTLSGNIGSGGGGGVENYGQNATATISNSTVSGNQAISGGGLDNNGGTLNVFSSIVSNNTTSDLSMFYSDKGNNLIGSTNALLSLANNGGPTKTIAIDTTTTDYATKIAGKGNCGGINTVTPAAPGVTVDQRGIARKHLCDIGAYETIPIDSIGIYRSGKFYLRLHNSTGVADITVAFTAGTKPYPIVGDWTGVGFDTIGVYDQSNGLFSLRNSNAAGSPDEQFVLGNPNDVPLSGRWLISAAHAGGGVFRPSNGLIYLKDALTTGYADHTMVLGIPGDVGLAGDWNSKGFDSPGVYRPSNSFFYLSNQVTNGSVVGDYQLQYGLGGDAPVIGDWIAQGHDGVGLFRQSNGFTYLKNALTTGYANNTFTYGIAGDVPVAGHWQSIYPPIAPPLSRPSPTILVPKAAPPIVPQGSAAGGNPIGD